VQYAEGDYFYYNCFNVYEEGTTNSYSTCDVYTPGVYSRIYSTRDSLGGTGYSKLVKGAWANRTLRIVMNSYGNPDGFVELYHNGLLIGRISGLYLDTDTYGSQTELDIVKFYWFYGGGDSSFAAKKDEYVRFDDLICFTYGEDYDGEVVRGRTTAPNGTVLDLPNGYRNADGSWTKVQR